MKPKLWPYYVVATAFMGLAIVIAKRTGTIIVPGLAGGFALYFAELVGRQAGYAACWNQMARLFKQAEKENHRWPK